MTRRKLRQWKCQQGIHRFHECFGFVYNGREACIDCGKRRSDSSEPGMNEPKRHDSERS